MPLAGYEAIFVLGGFFLLLGTVFLVWNRREKSRYYDSILLTKRDIKESLTQDPDRPWLHAWQIGGRISLIVGIALLITAGIMRLAAS